MAIKKIISPQSKVSTNRALARSRQLSSTRGADADFRNLSYLDDILYRGRSDRLERYKVYDSMDQDLDIARALDMIAEHCTKRDADTDLPFKLKMDENEITGYDSEILLELVKQWDNLNDWDNRIYRTLRNVIKYGDAFFIRDPETYLLHSVRAEQVVGSYIDDRRNIEAYLFRDLDFVIPGVMNFNNANANAAANVNGGGAGWTSTTKNGTMERLRSAVVDAQHVVHLSLSEGLVSGGNGQTDDIWPFGQSFLEQVYKDYKQRDMLESAALIHRIQRAPTRRVWYVDIGRMKADKGSSYMRRFRDSLMTKMFPNRMGGTDVVDSTYNPTSMMEDYFLPVTSDGRGTKVENLEGSQWNSMDDLKYWTDKILRGLRVPSSFMQGPESGGSTWNDGQMGIAYMAEQQFSEFCNRIQGLVDNPLDQEFKLYMKWRGVNVHTGDFELGFIPPMNFSEYRESALNSERLNQMSSANSFPFIAKRTVLMKYGNWTQDEILENEKWWREENRPDQAGEVSQDNEDGGMSMGGNFFSPMGPTGNFDDDQFGEVPGEEIGGGEAGMGAGLGPTGPGPAASPAAGAGGAPAGVESFRDTRRSIVESEDSSVPDEKSDESPEEVSTDHNLDDIGLDPEKPRLTLAHLRTMRIEREKNRVELMKRLRLIHTMYGAPAGPDQPF